MKKALLIGTAVALVVGAGAAMAHGPWRGHDGGYYGYHGQQDGWRGRRGADDAKGPRSQFGRGSGRMIEQRFAALDANKDGKVTTEEIDAARAARFKEMDADGDGSVTPEEMVQHQLLQRAKRRIARMDVDGDGKIQESELPSGGRMFSRFDLNGDGAVTKAEIEIARDAMGGGRGWGRGEGRGWGRGGPGWDRGGWGPAEMAPDEPEVEEAPVDDVPAEDGAEQ